MTLPMPSPNPSLPAVPARRPRRPRRGAWAGRRAWALLLALPLLLAAVACGSSGGAVVVSRSNPQTQMGFGVRMAQQGLWSEALFRFEQAYRGMPDDYRVINNLAVAYEATGRFDEALESYQKALQMAPDSRDLRRNYARFVEFYQSFRPQPAQAQEDGAEDGNGGGGAPPTGS